MILLTAFFLFNMITIQNFEIQNNGDNLYLEVETNIGYNITSVLLWNINTFKDYSQAINLDYKLENTSNIETITVTAEEININKFEDIWFVEIISDFTEDECNTLLTPALGITYNFTPYYQCLLNKFLSYHSNECINCKDILYNDTILTISLILEMLEQGIEYGYYQQVIDLLYKLKELCDLNKCNNCDKIICSSCSKYKQD